MESGSGPLGLQTWTANNQAVATRIVVEHRLHRGVGKDAAIPVESPSIRTAGKAGAGPPRP